MKTIQLILAIILLPLDFLMLMSAAVFAYFLRFETFVAEIKPVIYEMPFSEYIQICLLVAFIWIFFFALLGLYQMNDPKKIISELWRVIIGASLGLVTVVMLIFLRRELFSSRFIILTAWGLSIVMVAGGRLLVRLIRLLLYRKGIGTKKVVVVGVSKTSEYLTGILKKNYKHGFDLVSTIASRDFSKIKELSLVQIKNKGVDEIMVADNLERSELKKLVDFCTQYHIEIRFVPDFLGAQSSNVEISAIEGIPLLKLRGTRLEGWGRVLKRLFDLVCSAILIVLTAPIMIVIAIVISMTSEGGVFYRNQRVGKKGVLFNALKFRTMKIEYCTGPGYDDQGAAESLEKELIKEKSIRKGPVYKIIDDPRRTQVGKFLEKTSLDELPQFFNVFVGQMSLVGPRPHQPREVAQYEQYHNKLLSIKPGMTGLAQVSGRSDLDFEDEAKLDIFYIENWSLYLDMAIIIKTPFALFKRRRYS